VLPPQANWLEVLRSQDPFVVSGHVNRLINEAVDALRDDRIRFVDPELHEAETACRQAAMAFSDVKLRLLVADRVDEQAYSRLPWQEQEDARTFVVREPERGGELELQLYELRDAFFQTYDKLVGRLNERLLLPGQAAIASAIAASREATLTDWARKSRRRLIERWAAAGLADDTAAALADDPTVGDAPSALPSLREQGLVLLEGVFGSGKSVTGERLHQADLAAALRDVDAPVPVYLDARAVDGALADTVAETCVSVGVPEMVGVRLVLDGLDEVALGRAYVLLTQARGLTQEWPGSRVVATVRPGLPDIQDNQRLAYPPMSAEEAAALAQRIGGQPNRAPVASTAVREAMRLPLFVIIAALSYRETHAVPTSRIDFLENLVERALRRPGADISGVRNALSRLAHLAIEAGAPIPASEVGNDAEIEALIVSRLVVRRGRTLAFGLPILEQYFGGKSVLAAGLPKDALADAAALERWRYPLALALAAASWERSATLLQPIIDHFPGIAAWLLHESVPAHGRGSHASVPMRCGDRIHLALAAWLPALSPAADLLKIGSAPNTPPLVLAVRVEDDTLLSVIRHTPTDDGRTGVLALAQPVEDIRAFHGQDGSYRRGRPAADYSAWPWRWSLDWITDGLAELLKGKRLHAHLHGPAASERQWAQCRAVIAGSFNQEPLSAAAITARLRQILTPGLASIRLSSGWVAAREDLEALLTALEAGDGVAADGSVHCPFPAPDLPAAPTTSHYGHYSDEHLAVFVTYLHAAALDIYERLCEAWLPRLKPTLGMACILPVHIAGHVTRTTHNGTPTGFQLHQYSYETRPLPAGSQSTALFTYSESGLPAQEWTVTLQQHAELRQTIEILHPATAPWAHPRAGTAAIPSPTDTPATTLAYQWLWEDLRTLRLASGTGPH